MIIVIAMVIVIMMMIIVIIILKACPESCGVRAAFAMVASATAQRRREPRVPPTGSSQCMYIYIYIYI